MIKGPADHGLHVTYQVYFFVLKNLIYLKLIFLAIAMSSFLYCIIVTTTSSPLYQLSYQSLLAFSGVKVLRVVCEPNKQFTLIVGSPKKTTYRLTPFQIW